MVVGVTVDVLVIIFSVLAFLLLLALLFLFCVCMYRMCAERWRKRQEYDLTTQFEAAPPTEYPPPEYHNLSLSTGLVSTNQQAASRNRGSNYRSMSQAERASDATRNRNNDMARETLLSDVSNDAGDQSDNEDT
uniref:Uncharacterized protein n=1 Tax=Amphimedon queenslandica TaxID=400682 RepID=A0A1X7V1M1_AMPQE